uniref:La-related protein 1B n=1 Tax=Anthurium amnicola TaxID=1678845 RepID=A0A1D1XWM7_9ARAE
MAADPSSNPHSPQFRRTSRNLFAPWSHVVRGEPGPAAPPDPPATSIAPPEGLDRSHLGTAVSDIPHSTGPSGAAEALAPPPGGGGNAGAPSREKKPAWNRPSDGSVEAEPVMGAVSWPALSEATRASTKSSSSDSLKAPSDGSVFAPPAPVVTSSPSKPTANISNSNPSTNNAAPARQKSMKRGGGGNSSGSTITSKGGVVLPNGRPVVPPLMPPASAESSQNSSGKPVTSEPPIRDLTNKGGGNWDHGSRGGGFSSQLHGGNEHYRSYGGNKGGNNGVGGPHHNSGNRRDQGGTHEWSHRSFGGGRDVQMQQRPQRQTRPMVRPFLRPPQLVSPPFMPPPPHLSTFGSPMGYHDVPSHLFYVPTPPPPESLVGMPFVAPPVMFFAAPDPQLQASVAKQVDYYFSAENLCKDIYLRQNMDEEGWVPVSLIAGFNRVRNLTTNIQFILETLKTSTVVEVQGDKVRRRNDWMNWPPLAPVPNVSHPSALSNSDSLAARMRNVGLE